MDQVWPIGLSKSYGVLGPLTNHGRSLPPSNIRESWRPAGVQSLQSTLLHALPPRAPATVPHPGTSQGRDCSRACRVSCPDPGHPPQLSRAGGTSRAPGEGGTTETRQVAQSSLELLAGQPVPSGRKEMIILQGTQQELLWVNTGDKDVQTFHSWECTFTNKTTPTF